MIKKKIFATLTKKEYEQLCVFDYKDLYSIHQGAINTYFGQNLEIFCGINRYGKLFINVNFYPEGHRAFDFDELDKAIKWIKTKIEVVD